MSIVHYSLFESAEERRLIIAPADSDYRFSCQHEGGTYAESWLDAKDRLGFELTPTQKWLLDEQRRKAA